MKFNMKILGRWCWHRWGKWGESKKVKVIDSKGDQTGEVHIQERTCEDCGLGTFRGIRGTSVVISKTKENEI
jgi:hypothetical protein